jgi:oleate hydratase
MYYSKENYEAFARPKKPTGVDEKSAYLVGGGLTSLAEAAFLIRDGQMAVGRTTILEASSLDIGGLDGSGDEHTGWLIRGGREMESAFECLWDLYPSIQSIEIEGASVLDEFYRLNKADPNFSLQRTTESQGKDPGIGKTFTLDHQGRKDIVKLVLALPETLYDKCIDEIMSSAFFTSNFWLYWRTMFAFEVWHSALEMKLYVQRFIHQIFGLPDFSTLKLTKYNQYESLALPLSTWLFSHDVTIQHKIKVMNVEFNISAERKCAKRIEWIKDGIVGGVNITEKELVFVTNGSLVENSNWGDHKTPAKFLPEVRYGGSWHPWRNIAAQDTSFGRPDKYYMSPNKPSGSLRRLPH